jgi:hypothetical protein
MTACDPYYYDDALLLHLDGGNAQTSTIDSSVNAFPMSFSGNAALSTTEAMFGSSALSLPDTATSANTYISVPIIQGGPLDVLSGIADFTIEFWVWLVSAGGEPVLLNYGADQGAYAGNQGGLSFACYYISSDNNGVSVQPGTNAGFGELSITVSPGFALGAWNHVALVRYGTYINLYLNGVGAPGGFVGAPVWDTYVFPTNGVPGPSFFTIGWDSGVEGGIAPGYIDEVRVTAGLARYTANFVPAGPFGGSCLPLTSTLCGGFRSTQVFPPVMLNAADSINPKIYMPVENTTVVAK